MAAASVLFAPPVLAQARAALVMSIDEPGRNPYQEQQSNVTCRGSTVCGFNFAVVPAGKRLVLTHINGYVDTAAGTLPNGFVSASFGGPAYATLAFTGVRGPTSALGTRIFINGSPGGPVWTVHHRCGASVEQNTPGKPAAKSA